MSPHSNGGSIGGGGGSSSSVGRPQRDRRLSRQAQESESSGVELPGHRDAIRASPKRRKASGRANTAISSPRSFQEASVDASVENAMTVDESNLLTSLVRRGFVIYRWPRPVSQLFPHISDSQRAWKQAIDEAEGKLDSDEAIDADDWREFCGCPWMYGDVDIETCIAHTFVARAKRAFRGGMRWRDYEDMEAYEVSSTETAEAIEDADKRAIAMETALDNESRLAIFDAVKRRLREEIWLERYDG